MFVPGGSVMLKPGVPLKVTDVANVSASYKYTVVTSCGERSADVNAITEGGGTSEDVAAIDVLADAAGNETDPEMLPTAGSAGVDAVVPTAIVADAELAVGAVVGKELPPPPPVPPPPPPHAASIAAAPNAAKSALR